VTAEEHQITGPGTEPWRRRWSNPIPFPWSWSRCTTGSDRSGKQDEADDRVRHQGAGRRARGGTGARPQARALMPRVARRILAAAAAILALPPAPGVSLPGGNLLAVLQRRPPQRPDPPLHHRRESIRPREWGASRMSRGEGEESRWPRREFAGRRGGISARSLRASAVRPRPGTTSRRLMHETRSSRSSLLSGPAEPVVAPRPAPIGKRDAGLPLRSATASAQAPVVPRRAPARRSRSPAPRPARRRCLVVERLERVQVEHAPRGCRGTRAPGPPPALVDHDAARDDGEIGAPSRMRFALR